MGGVGSARYEPALLPPCPTIRALSYSNLSIFRNSTLLRVNCLSIINRVIKNFYQTNEPLQEYVRPYHLLYSKVF